MALGRKAWLFAGRNWEGDRGAEVYPLIIIAQLNDVDVSVRHANVQPRIADPPASCLHGSLPWNWHEAAQNTAAA